VPIFIPSWFYGLSLSRDEDKIVRNRYLLKAAALAHTPEGSMENLANDLQIHYHSLVRLYQPGRSISAQLAVRLEKTVGKEVIPRTLVRPDLFE
jgi:hypothetical protein